MSCAAGLDIGDAFWAAGLKQAAQLAARGHSAAALSACSDAPCGALSQPLACPVQSRACPSGSVLQRRWPLLGLAAAAGGVCCLFSAALGPANRAGTCLQQVTARLLCWNPTSRAETVVSREHGSQLSSWQQHSSSASCRSVLKQQRLHATLTPPCVLQSNMSGHITRHVHHLAVFIKHGSAADVRQECGATEADLPHSNSLV